ncbi:MAG: T9SS type A sorting domain-containing protein [Bacteroidia bacterium]
MKTRKLTTLFVIIIFAIGFRFLNSASSKNTDHHFHTEAQLASYRGVSSGHGATRAPLAPGEFFLSSESCRGCHGYDSAQLANITEAGDDVNLVDRWESSMMALAAKDPLWRAKVTHEITVNPAHAGVLQNKCLDCHAPMGAYTSQFHGHPYYGLSDLATDSLGLDGVSCGGCHMISPATGWTYSGIISYDTSHVEFGPFTAPFVGPMQLYEGFTPTYSDHMDQARLCSSCHTLITQSVDLSGNYTGGYFAEQATYHEYKNSSYPAANVKCQTCHMPQVNEGILIANGFSGISPRQPFNQHVFAGGNSFMLKLIKANKAALDISVPDKNFDSTIVATMAMLQSKSVDFDLQLVGTTSDTAYFKVKILNKAGHKFPSGYPARRAVLQFVVTDALGDTVFRSGIFNNQYRVIGENPAYEPHHDVISQDNVSQIYELVPGDVAGNFTSVLERASILLKDNRIPPAGFTTTASVYDTCQISADAIADADFNKVSSVEGSGVDWVHFAVPITGLSGNINVKSRLYYQSVPPKWVDNMFTYTTPEITTFQSMYNTTDQSPVLIAIDSINNVLVPTSIASFTSGDQIAVWPTVSSEGHVNVASDGPELIRSIDVLNSEGKLVSSVYNTAFQGSISVELPAPKGIYYLRVRTDKKIVVKKVVKT